MNKIVTFLVLCAMTGPAFSQTASPIKPFGKIDQADLELKACDFESDANAEVLFDAGSVKFTDAELVFERHVRIKIFNENGKRAANIHIEYFGGDNLEWISNLQAETINLNNGKIEITKVDKNQIFNKHLDKQRSETTFTFPDVKPGSVIEYKYLIGSHSAGAFPDWYFQSELPTRYSEIAASVPDFLHYKNLVRVNQDFAANERDFANEIKKIALANVPSIAGDEHYMSSIRDNLQCIQTQLLSVAPGRGIVSTSYSSSWKRLGEAYAQFEDYGEQFRKKLAGEEEILNHAKGLKSDDEKIAYIFNTVRDRIKWNEFYAAYTEDGTAKAWEKKIGNSTEINLIVYHLLMRAGIPSFPMLISTRKNGKVNPAYPNRFQFNTTVTYVPIDTANYYVLDASSKYNVYNIVPYKFLNTFGLSVDKENKDYQMMFIQNTNPAREVVVINADVKPEGKMDGTAQISSFSYNRIFNIDSYKADGEKKYIDNLREGNNDLKISSVMFENMDVDTLPLIQNVNFNLDLNGSDGTYIYVKPTMFSAIGKNPFLSEKRTTDIDFGYKNNYSIVGNFKVPAGFKVDALPKSVRMEMPDQSITFRRVTSEQDGIINVYYVIGYKKSIFFKEGYDELHDFYKKMYEMLGEPIVLKKS